jgi:hypothetical protein
MNTNTKNRKVQIVMKTLEFIVNLVVKKRIIDEPIIFRNRFVWPKIWNFPIFSFFLLGMMSFIEVSRTTK